MATRLNRAPENGNVRRLAVGWHSCEKQELGSLEHDRAGSVRARGHPGDTDIGEAGAAGEEPQLPGGEAGGPEIPFDLGPRCVSQCRQLVVDAGGGVELVAVLDPM